MRERKKAERTLSSVGKYSNVMYKRLNIFTNMVNDKYCCTKNIIDGMILVDVPLLKAIIDLAVFKSIPVFFF